MNFRKILLRSTALNMLGIAFKFIMEVFLGVPPTEEHGSSTRLYNYDNVAMPVGKKISSLSFSLL
jgi:hypothetical protein